MEESNFETYNGERRVELPQQVKAELGTALYTMVQNSYRGNLDFHTAESWVQEMLEDISSGKRTISSLAVQFYAIEENLALLLELEKTIINFIN